MKKTDTQKGRSLVELLAVMTLMALMSLSVYGVFRLTVDKAAAKTLEQEILARVTQLRHQALTSTGIKTGTTQMMSASGLQIQTFSEDTLHKTFTLRVGSESTPLSYDLCVQLMKRNSFSPNNSDACQKDQVYADFIFPK